MTTPSGIIIFFFLTNPFSSSNPSLQRVLFALLAEDHGGRFRFGSVQAYDKGRVGPARHKSVAERELLAGQSGLDGGPLPLRPAVGTLWREEPVIILKT